jgi:transposase
MKFIEGRDRDQTSIFPVSLDAAIDQDNEVRIIDLFVDSLVMTEMGFKSVFVDNGRPAYHPKDLLKLFIYGYLNRLRSSRALEKESKRNIELIWLLKGLSPDHNTINSFRKQNPAAIKKVFRKTVEIARNFNLIGGILLAGDGTKLRAQNSKKNNYNQKKIDRHLAYIDQKLEEYNQALATADGDQKQDIETNISKHKNQQNRYKGLEKELQETGEKQISTSDPDSKHLMIRGVVSEVAYNVQSTVDAKNKLPIDYEVTNENDRNALAPMVQRAIEILGNNDFEVVFDKGYHNAEQLHKCHQMGVETHVAITAPSSNAPDTNFNLNHFQYNSATDTYTCPANQTMHTNGNWYLKRVYRVKQYKTKACKTCPLKPSCTKAVGQRIIERHEFADSLERNRRVQEENPEIYKLRQSIVEHPFGTIKRSWGFDHIMTKKSIKHASADVGLIFVAYNLKRLLNLIGIDRMKEQIEPLQSRFLEIIQRIMHINHLAQLITTKILSSNKKVDLNLNLFI